MSMTVLDVRLFPKMQGERFWRCQTPRRSRRGSQRKALDLDREPRESGPNTAFVFHRRRMRLANLSRNDFLLWMRRCRCFRETTGKLETVPD